jgi:hypothetical protein
VAKRGPKPGSERRRVKRVALIPTGGDLDLHALTITLGQPQDSPTTRRTRWTEAALRSLVVDVLLLQLDRRHLGIGTGSAVAEWDGRAKGPTEALHYLATVERPYIRMYAPDARETVETTASGAKFRKLLPTRSDARMTIVLGGVPKGQLPAAPHFRKQWEAALAKQREGTARVRYEYPATFKALKGAYFAFLDTMAADTAGLADQVAAALAARRALLDGEKSDDDYFEAAQQAVHDALTALRAARRQRR